MEDRQDNGMPPVPDGLEPQAGQAQAQPTQIVPYAGGARSARRQVAPWVGLLWCVSAILVAPIVPPLAAYLAAVGSVLLYEHGEGMRRASALLAVLAICWLLLGGTLADVLQGAMSYLVGCLVGRLVSHRGTSFSAETLLTILLGVGVLACDALRAADAGTTLATLLDTEATQTVQVYAQQVGISDAQVLEMLEALVRVLWPSTYVVGALLSTWCAHLGARTGLRRLGAETPRVPLRAFDTPQWAIATLVAAILLAALGWYLGGIGSPALMVGANALVVVRVLLALDGFGVISAASGRLGFGRLGTTLVMLVAVNLEVSFLVVSGIGLIDFWANFRHLPRGASPVGGPRS